MMKDRVLLLVQLVTCLLTTASALQLIPQGRYGPQPVARPPIPPHSLLVFQWCRSLELDYQFHQRNRPLQNDRRFTLHGLWAQPNVYQNCSFNGQLDPTLLYGLEKKWPDYRAILNNWRNWNEMFWQHEWNSHGQCHTSQTQHQFFEYALHLYDRHIHLFTDFENQPNQQYYRLWDIEQRILRKVNPIAVVVDFICINGNPYSILQEIRLYITPTGNLMPQQPLPGRINNCPPIVYLP